MMKAIAVLVAMLIAYAPAFAASPTYTGNKQGFAVGTKAQAAAATNTIGAGDLYVADGLEVDGAARFDGATTFTGANTFSGASTFTGAVVVSGTQRDTVGTQTGITTSSAVVVTSAFMVITPTGTITSTVTPFISTTTATNGDYVQLMGTTNVITVQDAGTLTNSCLELGAATRALGAGDILSLRYYDGKWYETGFVNN